MIVGDWYNMDTLDENLTLLPVDIDLLEQRKYIDGRGRIYVFSEQYRILGYSIIQVRFLGLDPQGTLDLK